MSVPPFGSVSLHRCPSCISSGSFPRLAASSPQSVVGWSVSHCRSFLERRFHRENHDALEARPIPCVHRRLLPFSGGCAAAKTCSGTRFKDRRGMDWEQTRVDGLPEFRPTLLKSKEKRNYRQLWIFLPIGIAHAHGFYGRDAACALIVHSLRFNALAEQAEFKL